MNIWIWVWVALAVILAIAEIFTPGLFMLPFGIGAAVAALLEFLWPGSIEWQWGAFLVLSAVLLVAFHRIAERARRSPDSGKH